jgi:hypothetical protein
MRLVNAEASLPNASTAFFGVYGLGCVDADESDAFAGSKQQRVSVDDSLNKTRRTLRLNLVD